MQSLMSDAGADCATTEMPEELAGILRDGWYTADCGALLLVRAGGHARSWPCEAAEIAQREYEVNDIRIPDLDLDEDRETFLLALACRASGFAGTALQMAAGSQGSADLVAVVSVGIDDDYLSNGATVKFFTMRGNYPDWFDDLERFKSEAMMLLRLGDIGASAS
ncbi:hypothetical protein ACIA8G_13615 [Lentzea sp. NPDC051213]|uniref:hypothetical protein n=1 Tax=Lentzea sp. NPDC051213 TaxID=3364126 RepID=UPI0037973800